MLQIDEHRAKGHIPYRSWCEIRVRASGREDPHNHKAADPEEEGLPCFTFDLVNKPSSVTVV